MFTIPFPLGELAPVGLRPIRLEGIVAVPLAVDPLWTTAITFTVPKNNRAIIDGFGWAAQAAYTYSGSVVWQLAVNNQSYQLGSQVNQEMGQQHGTPQVPARTLVLLEPGDVVALLVRRAVLGAGTDTFGHVLTGVRWQSELNVKANDR